MKKILIFGNSGSGKSTLYREISIADDLPHLDLDTLAWQPTNPPERKSLAESGKAIKEFISNHESWVIEGCYTDLLEIAAPYSNEIIYLNLPIELCIRNAKNRPWEPHKYESKEAQDANLEMLIEWIGQYNQRQDCFSQSAHEGFYTHYAGKKTEYTSNERHT
ncbi:AAA family ATPase [Aestuariicella sp. G3-2]|uniref:AAA family ATPase n=1 Tax=Pseudomaricurvus albidus TaxID=2842452 RepID=UPI001C0C4DAA|nr:AAA family ATPase [Aestuariicella albida]